MKNKSVEEKKLEIREVTEDTLHLLGLSGAYKGFGYLIFGVELSIADEDILISVYKGLYPDTVGRFKTTSQCVERNIRTAREIIWKHGKKALRKEIFGERYQDTIPDNKDFVDALKNYIERQVNKRCSGRIPRLWCNMVWGFSLGELDAKIQMSLLTTNKVSI